MNLALEVESLDEIAERIRGYLNLQSPQGFFDKLKMLPKLAELGSFFPKTVKSGPCKEVIRKDDFSLDYFPILKCWPQDGGRYITWPMVITKNPETGKRNVGCYFDGTGVHGFIYHDGTFQYVDYPNAAVTWLTGVNDAGTIVGWSRSCDTCVQDPFVRWTDPHFTQPFWAGGPGFQPTGVNGFGLDIGFASAQFPTTQGEETNGGRLAAIPEPGTTVLLGAGALVLLLAKRFLQKQ
jgi:hypothetical protein